jgi:hypothetical protein
MRDLLRLRALATALALASAVAAVRPVSAGPADTRFQVEVEGLAAIENGNVPAARDRALQDALARAVERATSTLLAPDQLAQHDAALRAKVYPDAARFVPTYRIIAEVPSDTLYQTSVDAVVDREPLRQALVKLGLVSAGSTAGPLSLVTVTARGATRHRQITTLTSALVDRAQARVRYRSVAPGVVTLEVETPVPPQAVAEELARVQVEGARVAVGVPDGRRLEVVLTPVR